MSVMTVDNSRSTSDNSEYFRKKDVNTVTGQWVQEKMKKDPWFSGVVPNFRTVPADELPPGIDSATRFTSVCINTAIYLPWLVSQCLKSGVVFRRVIVGHVSEAAERHQLTEKVDVVVNCTGLSSARLGGVQDSSVIPARGQIVLVRNDPGVMCGTSGTDDGSDEVTYIMHRAAGELSLTYGNWFADALGGGGCILGGCYQKGDWESQPDPNLAIRIMRRCVELCPSLTGGKGIEGLSIIRHGVGLRPLREKGPRIEKEKVQGTWVVHHYGHGGYGYQASYGSAKAAVRLIEEVLDGKGPRSRL